MDEYVAKPVSLKTLSAALERCNQLAKKADEPHSQKVLTA